MAVLTDFQVSSRSGSALVTLADFKAYARIETTAEDTSLQDILDRSHALVEGRLGRCLQDATYVVTYRGSITELRLPRPRVTGVTSIEEYDEDLDSWSAVNASDWNVLIGGWTPRILPDAGWSEEVVRVTYTSTAPTATDDTYQACRDAVLETALATYEGREAPNIRSGAWTPWL